MGNEKRIAPESETMRKVREKIRKQWAKDDSLITTVSLAKTVDKIHQWIADNAHTRVAIQKKEIYLFDQNQNAAALSRKVQLIAQKIQESISSAEAFNSL